MLFQNNCGSLKSFLRWVQMMQRIYFEGIKEQLVSTTSKQRIKEVVWEMEQVEPTENV